MSTFSQQEIIWLFLFSLMFDVPRYFLAMIVLYLVPFKPPVTTGLIKISAIIACHNEQDGLRACIESLGVDEVVVVDDGSTDNTWEVIQQLEREGLVHHAIRLYWRTSKPSAVNAGLRCVSGDAVLILDSDTVLLEPFAAQKAARYLLEDDRVGGVGLNLRVRNGLESLTERFQALEYRVSITFGKRLSDAIGLLCNVSGAAGIFRRTALEEVGGLDIEVAEDAALTMKLRAAGWKIRFAPNAYAATTVPNTMLGLLMQRLRWDSAMVAIWLRKFAGQLNPFARNFDPGNFLTSLDVVLFSIILPILFPIYFAWLWMQVGDMAFWLLGFVVVSLSVCETVAILLTQPPLGLLAYIPYYLVVQLFIMRPARIVFVVLELVAHLTHRDNYIPKYQRRKLA